MLLQTFSFIYLFMASIPRVCKQPVFAAYNTQMYNDIYLFIYLLISKNPSGYNANVQNYNVAK